MVDIQTIKADSNIDASTQKIINGNFANINGAISEINELGNSFNGANELVQLDAESRLPAVDGSQLTGITAAQVGAYSTAQANGLLSGKAGLNGDLTQDFSANNFITNSLNGISLANLTSGLISVSYTGNIDGNNNVFLTDQAYSPLFVQLNGIFYSASYYTYSGNTLTWNTAPASGSIMNLYVNKGVFGLNNPLILNTTAQDVFIQLLTGYSWQYYSLPINATGGSLNITNYGTSHNLVIACIGLTQSQVSSSSPAGQNILYTANPSNFTLGQNIIINSGWGSAETNTTTAINSGSLTLKNNLISSWSGSQNITVCSLITVPPVNPSCNNIVSISSIAGFQSLQVFAQESWQVIVSGAVA